MVILDYGISGVLLMMPTVCRYKGDRSERKCSSLGYEDMICANRISIGQEMYVCY